MRRISDGKCYHGIRSYQNLSGFCFGPCLVQRSRWILFQQAQINLFVPRPVNVFHNPVQFPGRKDFRIIAAIEHDTYLFFDIPIPDIVVAVDADFLEKVWKIEEN